MPTAANDEELNFRIGGADGVISPSVGERKVSYSCVSQVNDQPPVSYSVQADNSLDPLHLQFKIKADGANAAAEAQSILDRMMGRDTSAEKVGDQVMNFTIGGGLTSPASYTSPVSYTSPSYPSYAST